MSAMVVFFFKQKTAYEMRIRDGSSDVCSSDLASSAASYRRDAHGSARAASQCQRAIRSSRAPISRGMGFGDQADQPLVTIYWHGFWFCDHQSNEIGRAACRERVRQFVEIWVVAGSLKIKQTKYQSYHIT